MVIKIQLDQINIGDAATIRAGDVFIKRTWIMSILWKAAFLKNFAFKCNETFVRKISLINSILCSNFVKIGQNNKKLLAIKIVNT